jgi:mTERF domain-containing protein, mitochondrial
MAISSDLAKRVVSSRFFSFPQYHYLALLNPLLRSPLSTQAPLQKDLPFIAEYLISSFSFSLDRALKLSVSKSLAPIKCPARPEAVVRFLTDTGLSETQIKAVVSFYPALLSYNVDKTLKPVVLGLTDAGCSRELLVQLIRHNPTALYLKDTVSRFLFWREFAGKDEKAMLKIIQRNGLIITYNIDKHVLPRINLLKEYGLSTPDIVWSLRRGTLCMRQNLDSLSQKLELIEELGIPRGSGMFLAALKVVLGLSKGTIGRKMEFFKKTYGWSQEDVNSAFQKFPAVLGYSEDKMKSNMDFLLRKAGFEPRSVASYPVLIGVSLERVLIPRYTVLHALKAKGLKKICSLPTVCKISERNFHERYIVPFEKHVPGLGQAYAAAFGLKVQV